MFQLYSKYNEALNQNVALDVISNPEGFIMFVGSNYGTHKWLQHFASSGCSFDGSKCWFDGSECDSSSRKTGRHWAYRDHWITFQDLEQRINDAHVKSAENLEEDNPTLEVHLSGSSMRRSTADESIEVPATADRFIEIFEGMFKDADDIVQIIKHVSKTETRARPEYEAKALEKARTMRQLIHSMLQIFRKARINPSVIWICSNNPINVDI